jgi:MFS family permease
MPLAGLSKRIADNRKPSYFVAFLFGLVPYIILLYLHSWNPMSILVGRFSVELSIFTGVIMRFIGGLGITLTYTTLCVIIFTVLSSSLKGRKTAAKQIYIIILLTTLIIILYAFSKIGGMFFSTGESTFLDFLLIISGVWSLVLLVYIVPLIKNEYRPELEQRAVTKAKETMGNWTSSLLKSYRTHITHDYGRVYESEFQRYRSRMFSIRALLSGLLLLPITFSLILIPPLAAVSILLWIRMFSLSHRHLSNSERGLLIFLTFSIGLLTTLMIVRLGLTGFRSIFDASYGFGLLSGIVLLFLIVL